MDNQKLKILQDKLSSEDVMSKILNSQSVRTTLPTETPIPFQISPKHGEIDNCVNLNFCSKIKISDNEICTANGQHKSERCTFGESRIILLLSSLSNASGQSDQKFF